MLTRKASVGFYNIFNFANFDLPTSIMSGLLTGTAGTIKAVLCADLSASLNPGRNNPRLILHEMNGKLVLRTMCMNVRAALYFILLENVLSGTGYRRCANKDCGMYYLAVKGRKFHSSTCQNAAKVRNWRERQKKQRLVKYSSSTTRRTGASTPPRR